MANDSKADHRSEIEVAALRRSIELEDLGSYVDLAREIKREVSRLAEDGAGIESIVDVFDRFSSDERDHIIGATFDRLGPDEQWSILERTFDDSEIRAHLAAQRAVRLDELARTQAYRGIVDQARAKQRLETREVPVDVVITLGLYREADVRAAVARGNTSDTCARLVVLQCRDVGVFQVIEDVFNPRGGYFVTRTYDEDSWRAERLEPHTLVGVGASSTEPLAASFEPVLVPGGRVDFDSAGQITRGQLHLGFILLGETDVFAG